MRNIQICSREMDRRALLVLACTVSASVGYWLPTPLGDWQIRLLDSSIVLSGGLCAWTIFRFLEPARISARWAVARVVGIPVFWLVVVFALAIWLYDLHWAQEDLIDGIKQELMCQTA